MSLSGCKKRTVSVVGHNFKIEERFPQKFWPPSPIPLTPTHPSKIPYVADLITAWTIKNQETSSDEENEESGIISIFVFSLGREREGEQGVEGILER